MKTNTINKKEIEKFSKIAEEWWNPEGKYLYINLILLEFHILKTI